MHRDLKLGLALAVLLIGSTTAFFFRSDTDPGAGLPRLQNPERLDAELAGRDIVPYLGEPEPIAATASPWAKPAFLGGASAAVRTTSVTPDPIRLVPECRSEPVEPGPAFTTDPVDVPEIDADFDEASGGPVAERAATEIDGGQAGVHVVRPGDTLSGLAARYLGNVGRFGAIYELNRDRLKGPNDLRVGMELRIPPRDASASSDEVASTPSSGEPAREAEAAAEPEPAGETASSPEPPADARKLFVPARKTPFVPGRYRSRGVPSADAPRNAERE